jgi:hypothetical protein
METSKLKIKLGPIEVEYEGSETFLKEELPQLLAAVSDLYAKSHAALGALVQPSAAASSTEAKNGHATAKLQATTGAIAAKLKVNSGSELIMAAAAKLSLVTGLDSFPRQSIIDEIKTASAYYKATYLNNLTSSLNALVRNGKLNEPSQGKYALTAASLTELEQALV